MKVFAQHFRGFRGIEVDLDKITFLVGDNSSGKSSILHLVDSVLRSRLNHAPKMNEDLGVSQYDYFSPFFDFANVTFGYSQIRDDGFFSKVITVSRSHDGDPVILRCSYLFGSTMYTIRKRGEGNQFRIATDIKAESYWSILEKHHDGAGFRNGEKTPKGVKLGDPVALLSVLNYQEQGDQNLISKLFGGDPDGCRLVSPIRSLPEKYYSSSRKISAHGLHFATMWHDFSKLKSGAAFKDAEAFGKESELFDGIRVKKISEKVPDSPLIVSVVKSGRELFLNQVGVGVSQVVPVLVEAVFALRSNPKLKVLIQQPELHLHPVAQSALGSYFWKAASSGLRGVLETHSSFLIDRFRSELREYSKQSGSPTAIANGFGADGVLILFCEHQESGNVAYEVSIDRNGKLVGEPESYHSFFVDEMLRTMF